MTSEVEADRSGEIAVEAYEALDIADRLIERAYGTDVPDEWRAAYQAVAEARTLAAAPTPLLENSQSCEAVSPSVAATWPQWQPIESYDGAFVVIVSRPTDRYIYDATTAFKDATGVWRVYRSEGGMSLLPFEPTHWLPLPDSPAPLVGDLGASCAESSGGKPTQALSELEGHAPPWTYIQRLAVLASDLERYDIFGGTRSAEAAKDVRWAIAALNASTAPGTSNDRETNPIAGKEGA